MQLYFARHGESEANVQRLFWNRPEKYGLTEKGRAQAHGLADNLEGTEFAALYCSPVLRAAQTAGIVGERLGLSPEVADGLREWDVGILDGQQCSPETDGLHRWVTEQWLMHGNHDARLEGGESYNDIVARFMPLIEGIEATYGGTNANVLLISHGGALINMLPLLLSNVDADFSLTWLTPYATPIVAELQDGEWVCLRWGKAVWQDGTWQTAQS
jgi:broad specificity phosphatase PhoE